MNALDILASRYGIEESFQDARGQRQTTPPATRKALLSAMGVDADSEHAARAALDTLDRQEWLVALPPVQVAYATSGVNMPVTLPAATATVTWHLTLENGEKRQGEAAFVELALLDRREVDGTWREKRSLVLGSMPLGYHRLRIAQGEAQSMLVVTPGQCWLPPAIEQNRRLWGVAAQLYLLKSNENWGLGDFTDLKQLVQLLIDNGADVVGLNPLHAMFVDDPEHASPYSPASRLLLNVLNIDVAQVARASASAEAIAQIDSDEFKRELKVCRESALVDYTRVTRLKISVLRRVFKSWREERDAQKSQAFDAFRRELPAMAERSCLFLALREHFAAQQPPRPDWREWPEEFKDPNSLAVKEFSREHAELVTFQVWLQFLADTQLGAAAKSAAPMQVGLYRDLAVGADPSGAETWSNAHAVITEAQVGAPPDVYNPPGQDWGLPPFSPKALREEGYRSFIELLRANMRHAGGLRIDHVMALEHLYWVPKGASADQGAYVRYPREDLIGILALESHRNQCLVVGEDLGTVPAGFRERMAQARILSYRVLFFEKERDAFIPPERYPTLALAVAGSHDLPTLRAWMSASDLELKAKLDLYPSEKLRKDAELERRYDRQELLAAFGERGLAAEPSMDLDQFADSAHAFLASTAAAITMLQIDDLTRESAPVNVPTTSDEHPNWRRRLAKSLEQIAGEAKFQALARSVKRMRAGEFSPATPLPTRASRQPWTGTYRLQLHADFPFRAAVAILPYLKSLGVSHVYLSPCLQAGKGSMHGYDVTDPTKISDDLGGEAGWTEFVQATRAHDIGILLDIVPNHMAATAQNAWWDDLLAQGPFSAYVEYFDVRTPLGSPFRVELCTLARAYGDALQAGELKLTLIEDQPRIQHYDNTWPLAAASWQPLLDEAAGKAGESASGCFTALKELLRVTCPSEQERETYRRCREEAQSRLAVAIRNGEVARAMERVNGDPEMLNAILSRQFYALHGWTLSGELTNFRRFFEVDSLIGVRTELEAVFEATHARIARMVKQAELAGLRVDHPDGLADPKTYIKRLRTLAPQGRIYVEKILENDERLDETWPLDGTVGYDFLAKVNRLWMDDSHTDALTSIYNDFTGHSVNVGALVRQKQREVLESAFFGDINRLSQMLVRIAHSDWSSSDLSPRQLKEALAAITAALPLYRTYRTGAAIDPHDTEVVRSTVQTARLALPHIDAAVFEFLETLLTKSRLDDQEADFAIKWQQLTPAVMAKGVEDTTFYVFDRLLSCNEVGASASMLGISSDKFHEYCHYLSEHWPENLLATSTHDNKRSEDVRTRISLLSEIPERWSQALREWSTANSDAWRNRNPDRHAEYLLYQTLIGAWPISEERCWQYMQKALREAKINTSWHQPNPAYEEKIKIFTENIFKDEVFLKSLESFVAPLILPGRINSLAQTLLKMIVPGVPDFYQGSELWDLSLVDPDNRRPVDYKVRAALLEACDGMAPETTLRDWESGLPKLWMIARILKFRTQRPEFFSAESKYQPMAASGARLSNLFTCRRGDDLIAIVPRFGMSVADRWEDTNLPLPKGDWRNLFSGAHASGSVSPAQIFCDFPVAVLIRQ